MAAELGLLAIASAFWPALVAIVIIALRSERPSRLLLAFLAGGLATTIGIGIALVYALRDSSLISRSRSTTDPVVYLSAGAIALVAAFVIERRVAPKPLRSAPADEDTEGNGRMDRLLRRGVPVAFLVGVVVNIVPGVLPFVALKDIAELHEGAALTSLTVTGFYLVMFAFVEIPLVAYGFAPARTMRETVRFNAWLDANARRLAALALGAVGAYLVLRGGLEALTA